MRISQPLYTSADCSTPTTEASAMENMPADALAEMAAYFKVLAEPTRLQILNLLRSGERNVGELAQMTGYTAANVSRHLALMSKAGIVERESRGTAVFYRIADQGIYALCDVVCGNIARQISRGAAIRAVFKTEPD